MRIYERLAEHSLHILYNSILRNQTTLGISPGTRVLGIAILQDQELIEWKVKTVNGKWTKKKLHLLIRIVENIINEYHAGSIVVKVFHESRLSIGLKQLIAAFEQLAKTKSCIYYTCTIHDLKGLYTAYDVKNKTDLIKSVVSKHPELMYLRDKELKNRNRYYTKMFEAVACAHTCLKKQSQ